MKLYSGLEQVIVFFFFVLGIHLGANWRQTFWSLISWASFSKYMVPIFFTFLTFVAIYIENECVSVICIFKMYHYRTCCFGLWVVHISYSFESCRYFALDNKCGCWNLPCSYPLTSDFLPLYSFHSHYLLLCIYKYIL